MNKNKQEIRDVNLRTYCCPVCRNEVESNCKTHITCSTCGFVWDDNPPQTGEGVRKFREHARAHKERIRREV